ncbi:MAG: winged helix-turn-helix domain-containing protein [Candidatus Bathyarchaeota archaeon]|nr:winged helix-turn-helix domain-containing protein [Candidatus Bathyarchaeota archaeon]
MRRSQRQIIKIMLELATDGIKKTPLMFKSYLSWKQLEPYLKLLLDRGLLREESPYYYTTLKGESWLEAYEALRKFEEPADA